MRRGVIRWNDIRSCQPSEGQDVYLFLMDGEVIKRKWSKECDKMARESKTFLDGRYPRYWVLTCHFD